MITDEKKAAILREIAFLDNYPGIRSIVLVGSTVLGHDDEGSDTDIVVVSEDEMVTNDDQQNMMFRKTLRGRFYEEDNQIKANYSLLSVKQLKHLFELGSPYANSIRHGLILKDNEIIGTLIKDDSYPLKPTMEHYVESLELILYHLYLLPMCEIESKIREHHKPGSWCEQECRGHFKGGDFAAVLFRLLYLTLPLRGYMPLSKKEAMRYAGEVYGDHAVIALMQCLELLRQDRSEITAHEYWAIKPLAVELFQDCMRLLDVRRNNKEIKKVLLRAGKRTKKTREILKED